MNLKNGQITIGEILQNQNAAFFLRQELPQLAAMLNTPMGRMARQWSLNAALAQARGYMPQEKINYLLAQLQGL